MQEAYKKTTPLRGSYTARVFRLAIMLSQRSYLVSELAERFHVSRKTVYRDLATLEMAGVPVQQQECRYSIEHHFMRRFL